MTKRQKPANTESKHEDTETKSVHSSKSKVAPVVAKNNELEGQLKRALADYQNLEKRIEEERRLLSRLSASLLIEKLLPVLDNIENAQNHLKDQGLEIVIKQFKDVLKEEGVEEIVAEGTEFNPNYHEAIQTQVGEKDNIVVKVIAKGYKIENTVLRPAKVVVTKKAVEQKTDQEGQTESKSEEISDYA